MLAHVPFFVDDPMTDALAKAYEASPTRLVLVNMQHKVVFATGQAPLQFNLGELARFLYHALHHD